MSMQKVKVKEVTELMTPFSCLRTVTHIEITYGDEMVLKTW